MRFHPLHRIAISGLTLAILSLLHPGTARAQLTVDAGYDLFQTDPTQTFAVLGGQTIFFMGVPLGTSNSLPGMPDVGLADTIVQRLSAASGAAGTTAAPIGIQLVNLQLESVNAVDLTPFGGTGMGHIFATADPSQAQGSMSISFDAAATPTNQFGTFIATLPVNVDLRIGSLTATPFATESFILQNPLDTNLKPIPTNWTYLAPSDSVLLTGINHDLQGKNDDSRDFWPGVAGPNGGAGVPGGFAGAGGPADTYLAGETTSKNDESHFYTAPHRGHMIPEPASLTNLAIAGLLGLGYSWRRRRKATAA